MPSKDFKDMKSRQQTELQNNRISNQGQFKWFKHSFSVLSSIKQKDSYQKEVPSQPGLPNVSTTCCHCLQQSVILVMWIGAVLMPVILMLKSRLLFVTLKHYDALKLEYKKISLFTTSWTVNHPIDEESPLYGLTENDLKEMVAKRGPLP